MEFQLSGVIIAFLPTLIYAVGGLWDAYNKKESVSWILFIKTIVTGLVASGLINMNTSDMIEQLAATTIITIVLDKLWNSILRKDKALPPMDVLAPAPSSTPPKPPIQP